MEREQKRFDDILQTIIQNGKHVIAVDETGFVSSDMPKIGSRLRPITICHKRTKLSCVMAIDTMGIMLYDLVTFFKVL